jgi:hypothetical protein
MNPLAQTFTYYEPQNGIDGVFVTGIDIYFQSVDPVYGVTLQIRDTVNGEPSTNIIPYATKHLTASQVNSSTNASTATNFTFETPVIIQSNHQYAIVVIPDGGSPNYNIWTSVLGGADVTTGNQVFKNNQLGTLFISSNDLSFTSIPLESIKYNLYTATFNTSGNAIFRNSSVDFFRVNNIIGNFIPNEMVYVSNNQLNIGYANLTTAYANIFVTGTTIYQGASLATSTANAIVYGTPTTSLVRFSNSQGTWAAGTVTCANSPFLTQVVTGTPFQNTATFSNTTISTPDSAYTDYTVGNYLYVATPNKTSTQVVQVAATTNSTAFTVTPAINFTGTGVTIGRVRGDANLYGYFTSTSRTSPTASFILGRVTSNSLLNFTNSANQYLIGGTSGALGTVVSLFNPKYDSITPQFAQVVPNECFVSWGFSGISNTAAADGTYTARTYTPLTPDTPYQFIDQQRMIMSRSNEVSNTTVLANSSLQIQMGMGTSNNLISPYTDTIRNSVTLTNNKITPPTWLYGYSISIYNANGAFNVGDNITQTNTTTTTTATIISSNSTYLQVVNVTSSNTNNIGLFNANGISNVVTTAAWANVSGVAIASEPLNASFAQARYISKVVNLAAGQDAEDIITYLGAYRPPGTNIFVYSKVLHAQDSATFNSKDWSFMPESTSQALISSLVNTNDLVELIYTLPSSALVYSSGITTNTTTAIVTFPAGNTNANFTANSFLYLADQSYVISGASVSAGTGYTNGDVVQLTGTAGYLNANATFNVLTNSTGVPISVVVANVGSYMANTTITANTVTNVTVTGAPSGLLLTITGSQFTSTNKFNVRQVVSVPNTTAVIVNSNTSINSSNVAIGLIANLQSQAGAFKYTANSGNIRYVNYVDSVFDNYLSFAIKIVMTSNTTQIIPRMTDMRTLALQI